MRVEVLTVVTAFHTLRAEWLRLIAQLPFQSVFFTPQWYETWWRHFGADRQLHILTIRSDEGILQGLAPLMLTKTEGASTCLEFIGDLELCDYLDLFVAPTYQHEVGQLLVDYLIAKAGDDGALQLRNLSQASSTPQMLYQGLAEQGLKVDLEVIETCPTIRLPDNWETYLSTLRGKDRHELRRKVRRAEATVALEYYVTHEDTNLDADVETFIHLHRMSQQDDKQGFMTMTKAAFFRDMAHQLWSQGWLELAFLHADGHPIAGLCCFAYGQTYAAYNSGYDPAYKELSAGIVLFANRIHHAIQRGFTTFDFLRGNEPYKYRFGAKDQPLLQCIARMACPVQGSCL